MQKRRLAYLFDMSLVWRRKILINYYFQSKKIRYSAISCETLELFFKENSDKNNQFWYRTNFSLFSNIEYSEILQIILTNFFQNILQKYDKAEKSQLQLSYTKNCFSLLTGIQGKYYVNLKKGIFVVIFYETFLGGIVNIS